MKATATKAYRKCWNCNQPATHTMTREGSNTLHACDNCTRIDRAESEKRGWTITPLAAMNNHILIDDIARRARANAEDIHALASESLWRGMMHRDEQGRLWAPAHRESLIYGALGSEADIRRDARVQSADEELLASYADLNRMSPRSASGIRSAARRQQQMLASVLRVLDALEELVDAKLDARRMDPEVAEALKVEVAAVRRDAGQNAARALVAIRSLLDIAA